MIVHKVIKYSGKKDYVEHNGPHFTKDLLDFAVDHMYNSKGKITPNNKEAVDSMLKMYNITLLHDLLYDAVFVANMALADFYGSSIKDELHLALYIKDMIDDVDLAEGYIFFRWASDMKHNNIEIDWESYI